MGKKAGMILLGSFLIVGLAGWGRPGASPNEMLVARGKYLVNNVAQCGDCHTPRMANGELDPSRWLQGTLLDFQPIGSVPHWAKHAPAIAGLHWDTADAIKFFETGHGPRGGVPDPPMPQYHMNHHDASAVVAYLKSLPSPRKQSQH